MSDFYFEVLVRNSAGELFHKASFPILRGGDTDFGLGTPLVIDERTLMFGYKLEPLLGNNPILGNKTRLDNDEPKELAESQHHPESH